MQIPFKTSSRYSDGNKQTIIYVKIYTKYMARQNL